MFKATQYNFSLGNLTIIDPKSLPSKESNSLILVNIVRNRSQLSEYPDKKFKIFHNHSPSHGHPTKDQINPLETRWPFLR